MTVRRRGEHADHEAFAAHDHDDHEVTVEYDETGGQARRRGSCVCGWRGPWRRGANRHLDSVADGDDHANDHRPLGG